MLKNLSIQALVFFIIFHSISWFRELSLLNADGTESIPPLSVQLPNGDQANLSQYSGRPVLYYFWAPWCTVCKVSMPNLEDFHQSNKGDIQIVAVALSYDSPEQITDFMADKEYNFDYVLGNMDVSEAFKIKGFPTYYLADKNGKLVAKSMGYTSELGMKIRSSIL